MNSLEPNTIVDHFASLMRLSMRICCQFLALFALCSLTSPAYSNPCGEKLGEESTVASSPFIQFENGAGLIKDLYALPFPRFQYLEARAIAVSDVETALNAYLTYANAVEALAHTLPKQEQTLLLKHAQFIKQATADFAKTYSSFSKTSEAISRIISFSNKIKGHDFETAMAIALIRQGFTNVTVGASIRDFIIVNMHENIARRDETEVDIFAEKNGESYLVEIKSLKPTEHTYLEKEIENAKKQIERRDQLLKKTGIRSKMKIIVIQHFHIGEEVRAEWLKAGADHVFFFRKEYLDDFNSYTASP